MQAEKLQICVDATVDTYKVVPDALIEALSEQNLVLAKEEVHTREQIDHFFVWLFSKIVVENKICFIETFRVHQVLVKPPVYCV